MKKNEKSILRIEKILKKTYNKKVLSTLNHFSGLFKIYEKFKYKNPVLVSGTDGVGTKLYLYIHYKKYSLIGKDCFAMCVNDVICHGANPLFFLDYLSCNKINFSIIKKIIEGIAEACKNTNTCLIGGEIAEMQKLYYQNNLYDIAGFCVGIVEKDNIINGHRLIKKEDIIIGFPSSGVHSNGFTTIRNIFSKNDYSKAFNKKPLYETLLTPTKIYYNHINMLKNKFLIHGIAHITGGGILHNLYRIIPKGLSAVIEKKKIPIQPIFKFIQKKGNLSENIMWETFNMGIGMIIIVSQNDVKSILSKFNSIGEYPKVIGFITENKKKVSFMR